MKDRPRVEINSEKVKDYGIKAGAQVVGIASSKDFGSAPEGYKPTDVMEECVSVIVLGILSPKELLTDNIVYTEIRQKAIEKTAGAAKEVAKRIKKDGYKATSIGGFGGKYLPDGHHGPISMKHTAEIAGLGTIGRNHLLINPEYGNLLWFSAVLTDAELVPDEKVRHDVCDGCNICVESCPINALEDPDLLKKKECGNNMYIIVDNKWEINCFTCRQVCPYCFGIKDR